MEDEDIVDDSTNERYRLEIWAPNGEIAVTYRSDHPFLPMAVGDVIDSSCLHRGKYERDLEFIENAIHNGADATKMGDPREFPIPETLIVTEVRHILHQRMSDQNPKVEVMDVWHSVSVFTKLHK